MKGTHQNILLFIFMINYFLLFFPYFDDISKYNILNFKNQSKIIPEPDAYPRNFRIFDIVLYHNEPYMLLIRLLTLRKYVDIHYIGFSFVSFSRKIFEPLTFHPLENQISSLRHRFYLHQFPNESKFHTWDREIDMRHQLVNLSIRKERIRPDDLIIWSDLDEIPLPDGMEWICNNPPSHFYRFTGYYYMYNFRIRKNGWNWAYIIRYGSKGSKTFFEYRAPEKEIYDYVFHDKTKQSLYHCSFCFPTIKQYIHKLKSFSHVKYSFGHYIDPNFIYTSVYCGTSLFEGQYNFTDFEPRGLQIPNSSKFAFLRQRLSFSDLGQYRIFLRADKMNQYSSCHLDFIKDGKLPEFLPNNIN